MRKRRAKPDTKPKTLAQMTPEEHVRAVPRTCRGPRVDDQVQDEINRLLAAGAHRQARELDSQSRKPCGYDFNDLIVKNGFDGKERTVACPKCGQSISYRAPLFETPKAKRG